MYNEAVCQVTTLMTLLNGCLLKSVTENSALTPVHYERIFMYCMAWGLGGLVDAKDRPALDTELRNMSEALPKKVIQILLFALPSTALCPAAQVGPHSHILN